MSLLCCHSDDSLNMIQMIHSTWLEKWAKWSSVKKTAKFCTWCGKSLYIRADWEAADWKWPEDPCGQTEQQPVKCPPRKRWAAPSVSLGRTLPADWGIWGEETSLLFSAETHLESCAQPLIPQSKGERSILEDVQQKVRKMIKGLEIWDNMKKSVNI